MSRRSRRLAYGVVTLGTAALLIGLAVAQTATSMQRDTFAGRQPLWQRGPASVPAAEESHTVTEQFAYSPPGSEYLRVRAEPHGELNPFLYYSYPTHPAPVGDDLTASVRVRANR